MGTDGFGKRYMNVKQRVQRENMRSKEREREKREPRRGTESRWHEIEWNLDGLWRDSYIRAVLRMQMTLILH